MAKINLLPWRTERRKLREREFYMMLGAALVAGVLAMLPFMGYFVVGAVCVAQIAHDASASAFVVGAVGYCVLFVGDILMPYLGAPFTPEGSVDGLLEAIDQVHTLKPVHLLHGHEPLTRTFSSTGFGRAEGEKTKSLMPWAICVNAAVTPVLHRSHRVEALRRVRSTVQAVEPIM